MMKLFSTIDSTLPVHRRISGVNHVMTILTLDHSLFHVVQCERKFRERQQAVGSSLDARHMSVTSLKTELSRMSSQINGA